MIPQLVLGHVVSSLHQFNRNPSGRNRVYELNTGQCFVWSRETQFFERLSPRVPSPHYFRVRDAVKINCFQLYIIRGDVVKSLENVLDEDVLDECALDYVRVKVTNDGTLWRFMEHNHDRGGNWTIVEQ